ncbi:MAG: hypothetical protein HC793_00660 [Aquincola sp.]|nr:hypothetical protein [Aquincola sp.]
MVVGGDVGHSYLGSWVNLGAGTCNSDLKNTYGTVRVPVVVSIVPWGKDWKAALPLELQAQIDDLRTIMRMLETADPPLAQPLQYVNMKS